MSVVARDYQDQAKVDVLAAWGEKPWHSEGAKVKKGAKVKIAQ